MLGGMDVQRDPGVVQGGGGGLASWAADLADGDHEPAPLGETPYQVGLQPEAELTEVCLLADRRRARQHAQLSRMHRPDDLVPPGSRVIEPDHIPSLWERSPVICPCGRILPQRVRSAAWSRAASLGRNLSATTLTFGDSDVTRQ